VADDRITSRTDALALAGVQAVRPRVGHIQFLNCLPLYDGLVRSSALLDIDLRKDTPDRLNDALVGGELDIGPISLISALCHASDLVVLPDFAVGSDGPVLSVVLVSTRPLQELDGSTVALGSTSRTSVVLCRMLLEQQMGIHPSYEVMPPDLSTMLQSAEAAVLIGDVALRATYEAQRLGLYLTDLGSAWKEWTGLPMVFAVWAARADYARAHPGLVKDVQRAFASSLSDSLRQLDAVAERAARWEIFDAATLAGYFRSLDFRLGTPQRQGIEEFARRAVALGVVPPGSSLTFAEL
jgi:chorismate dehydratase